MGEGHWRGGRTRVTLEEIMRKAQPASAGEDVAIDEFINWDAAEVCSRPTDTLTFTACDTEPTSSIVAARGTHARIAAQCAADGAQDYASAGRRCDRCPVR